ncbi:uncharacterized protein BKA78DRAFT_61042 [Phyllosticta capitalensis]|uniref:uncharacterized protein n=1 Tax=Phyllosticta capitalensis TaxID=121624 RepID=UPI00312E0E20
MDGFPLTDYPQQPPFFTFKWVSKQYFSLCSSSTTWPSFPIRQTGRRLGICTQANHFHIRSHGHKSTSPTALLNRITQMVNTASITPATMPLAMSSNNNVNKINNVSSLESPSTTSSSPPSSSSLHNQTCPHKDDDIACECKTAANANNTPSAKSFPFPPQSSSSTKKSEHEDDAINPLASPPLAALTKTTSNTGSHKSKRFSALRRGLSRTTTSSKRQSKSVYESGSDSEGERQRQRIKRGEEGQLAGVALAYIMQYRRGVMG